MCLYADRPGYDDMRIEFSFGDADARRFRVGRELGLLHIRPTSEQRGQNAHDDFLWGNGN